MSHISVARQACAETDMWLERAWVSVPRERLGVGQCASGAPRRELKCRATEMWLESPLSQSTEPLSQSTEPSQTSHSFPMRERERERERERGREAERERGSAGEAERREGEAREGRRLGANRRRGRQATASPSEKYRCTGVLCRRAPRCSSSGVSISTYE
jgi:hypothetical protein